MNVNKKSISHKSDTYILPIKGDQLLYAPQKQISALLNRKAVSLVYESFTNGIGANTENSSFSEFLDRLESTTPVALEDKSEVLDPYFLGIISTRACNLACVYCAFGAADNPDSRMDIKLAKEAVNWMAKLVQDLGRKTLPVYFFGGEPLIADEVVDVVIHRARYIASKMGLIPHFEVSTNGVFSKQRAEFIGDYFDTVVLSFDGTKEIHDRNRPVRPGTGSFDRVSETAKLLSSSPVELCLRTCITSESVEQMERLALWFAEEYKPSTVNFETLQMTPESEAAGLRPPDPYEFALNFVRSRRRLQQQGIETVYAAAETSNPRFSFCPVGKDTVILSPDGRISSCYLPSTEWKKRGLDMDLGHFKVAGNVSIDMTAVKRLRGLVREKPFCEQCFCYWTCAGGCHVNHTFPGGLQEYNDFCIQTRIISAALLMEDLGLEQELAQLLTDKSAMERLAFNRSDRLEDWQDG